LFTFSFTPATKRKEKRTPFLLDAPVFVGNTRREEKRTSRNSKRFIFLLLNIYLLLSSQPELRKIGRQLFFDVVFARHFPQLCASTLVVTDETFFAKKKRKKNKFFNKIFFLPFIIERHFEGLESLRRW
jgi:hypothetical protein